MTQEPESCPIDDPVGPTEDPMAYTWDGRKRKWILDRYYHTWAEANNQPIER